MALRPQQYGKHTLDSMFPPAFNNNSLVGFTCLLALSNLGTSLAAAFLAKDTTTSKNNLVDMGDQDHALGTQRALDSFTVDLEEGDEYNRRMLDCECTCAEWKGNGNQCKQWDEPCGCTTEMFVSLDLVEGQELVKYCRDGRNVALKRSYISTDGKYTNDEKSWIVCGDHISLDATSLGHKKSQMFAIKVGYANSDTMKVEPVDPNGGDNFEHYSITPGSKNKLYLVNAEGERCDVDSDCAHHDDKTLTCPEITVSGADEKICFDEAAVVKNAVTCSTNGHDNSEW